jgi:Fe-S-cluster containining protein
MQVRPELSCMKCAAFCCRMAGYVSVSRADIRRLAKYLGLTVREFEEKHIVEKTRKGEKRIKRGYDACQFLKGNRLCGVYEARPKDCRGYVCWDQDDDTVYRFAEFYQHSVARVRRDEAEERRKGER